MSDPCPCRPHLHAVRSVLTASLLAVLTMATAAAQSIDCTLGCTIDCPLPLSSPDHVATRTVVFPNGAITDVPAFWDAETQLYVKIIRNSVVLQLRDSRFSATLQVFDDKGDLFLLDVHAAPEGSSVDDVLLLRPSPGPTSSDEPGPGTSGDSDGQITELMAAMLGRCPPTVVSSPVTHVEHGALAPGRHLYADAAISLDLMRLYQAPHLRGYQCLLRYHGTRILRLDQSRLWFPGALAVYASSQVFIDPRTVAIDVHPEQSILLYFVAE